MRFPDGEVAIIESARAAEIVVVARTDGFGGELAKAQLRVVSGPVPHVGWAQREADFGGCFSLGHKGFAARIQVTY
jgi:hypothetical protein